MISVPPMGAARVRAPFSPLSYLTLVALATTLLVGCGTSGTLTRVESEPGISIKNLDLETKGAIPYSKFWADQGRPFFSGVQPLSDGRTMVVLPDDMDDEQTTFTVKMFGPTLNELWSVQQILGATMAVIGVSAENDKAHMLAVKYDEDADIDSVRLVRYSFANTDGHYLSCDTIARARGTLEVDNGSDSGFMAYRMLRSPDSSKILVYQQGYQFEHTVTKLTTNVLVLDRSCNVLYSRTVECPVSSYEVEPDPDDWEGQILGFPPVVDNSGGFYVVSVEAGKTLRASYYRDRDALANTSTYKLNESAFKPLFGDDVEDMTFSRLIMRALDDRLLVSTNVIDEERDFGRIYGFASVEFPRASSEPKVRVLHPFSESFAERLADDDEADGMSLVAAVPFSDGSLVVFFDHIDHGLKMVYKKSRDAKDRFKPNPVYESRFIDQTEIDRFGAIHYGADGQPKWVGSIDDDYYGVKVENDRSQTAIKQEEVDPYDLSMREIARNDHTVDIAFNYQDDHELRTLSFDISRDTLTIGRSLAGIPAQVVMRSNILWSTPSRLLIAAPAISFFSSGLVLNLIETTDGKPLFAPRNLDD